MYNRSMSIYVIQGSHKHIEMDGHRMRMYLGFSGWTPNYSAAKKFKCKEQAEEYLERFEHELQKEICYYGRQISSNPAECFYPIS